MAAQNHFETILRLLQYPERQQEQLAVDQANWSPVITLDQINNYPPEGLLWLGFRIPVYVYRFGFGWLLGERFALINHVGRKTGLPHQAVVEVVERNKEAGSITVVAGYGQQTDWYQNLKKHPNTTIQIGVHRCHVAAEFIAPEAGEEILVRCLRRSGKLAGKVLSVLGYLWDSNEKGMRQIARDSLRFVRFVPFPKCKLI